MGLIRNNAKTAFPVAILTIASAAALVLSVYTLRNNKQRDMPDKQRSDLTRLSSLISGAVVYQRENSNLIESIYRTDVGCTETVLLARDGRYPRWSPDGRKIAFLRRGSVMLMNSDGSSLQTLVAISNSKAIAWHPGGMEVLFTSDNSILAVDISTRAVREVASGKKFAGMDLGSSGKRLLFSAHGRDVYVGELPSGEYRRITKGCSVSFSPDAEFFLHNNGGHRRLSIRRWTNGEIVRDISAPEGFQVDNVKWSNHPDWIAVRTEGAGTQNVFAYRISENRYYQVTFCGDANRPDLFISEVRPRGEKRNVSRSRQASD